MSLRRFTSMPSIAVLLALSGVVIIDAPPPVPITSASFGRIAIVGETEDGPFNTPTPLLTSSDQSTIFGLLGYSYNNGAQKNRNACAFRSGGNELWNGNLWLHSSKLYFGGLAIVRVDNSIGQVALTPRAFVQGSLRGPFLLDAGQTFTVNANGAGAVTFTFAAAAAAITASAGTYTSFAGGEVLTLALDGGSSFDVTFQASDTTLSAIISRINTAYGQTIAFNVSSQLKISSLKKGTGSRVFVKASAVSDTLDLTVDATTDHAVNGTGDVMDISQTTQAELKAKVEGNGLFAVSQSSDGYPRIVSKLASSGTIQVTGGTATAALGFLVGAVATTAAIPAAGVTVAAGARAWDGSTASKTVVLMQTTVIAAGSVATTLFKVRPALDDGSFVAVAGAGINALIDRPGDLEWSVSNPVGLTDALTASQLDSRYADAIAATKGPGNDITKKLNGVVSARQSNAIRSALKTNAIEASAQGHFGRRAFLCPPNGTTAAQALAQTAPGVGAYRAEEVAYCAGGVECTLQELIDGGYSTDGYVIRHPDVMLASRWSVLNPGYNPGQYPENQLYRWNPAVFSGLEPEAKTWDQATYIAFKASGICGAEFDSTTGVGFEQGVTSVDPSVDPDRTDISRKTLSDYIADTCSGMAKVEAKRQGTQDRRLRTKARMEGFIEGLIPDTVEKFSITLADPKSQPTHVVRYDFNVKQTQSDDVIVFNMRVSANGDVTVTSGS